MATNVRNATHAMAGYHPIAPMTLTTLDEDVSITDNLNDQQQLFVDWYLVTLNQTEAYRQAGYKGNEAALAVGGSQLIRVPKVARAVEKGLRSYSMSAAEALARLTDIARGDISLAIDENGDIDPRRLKQAGKGHLIKKFRRKTYTTMDTDGNERVVHETEIELHDPLDALRVIAKAHGLLVQKISIEHDEWKLSAIEGIRKGEVVYPALAAAFSTEIAAELFLAAGIAVPATATATADIVEGEYTEQDTDATTTPAQPDGEAS